MNILFITLFLFIAVASIHARRRPDELNPSCIDAGRVKTFVGRGTKGIEKALAKFNALRDESPQAPRNINWDGAAVTNLIDATQRADLPGDLFLNGGGFRQILFSEPLTAATDSFQGLYNETEFESDIGADPFSNPVNVAPLDTNKVVVSFTLEDRKTAGLVDGFGAIFTDVESSKSAGLEFYDSAGALLKTVFAKKGKSGVSQFVGAVFDETVVASVHVLFGDNGDIDLTSKEGSHNDFVAVDDWFFFLSDTEVPTVTYRGEVEERDDEIISQFETRRLALDFDQVQNINWDGGAVTVQTAGGSAELDRDLFLVGAGERQLTIALQSEDPTASENEFGHSASAFGLGSFTGTVNFAPLSSQLTINFFLADQSTTGLIHGFGVIFTDVELPLKSGLKAFDENGKVIANVRARVQESGTHQFIGVMFNQPRIAKIVLDMADDALLGGPAEDLENGVDLVAVDDWLFFKSTTAA